MRRCIVSFLLALILSAAPGSSQQQLTVVFTGNTTGKLEACDCPNDPYGGLAERVSLMRELREEEPPFLLVDAGRMVSLIGDYPSKGRLVMDLMDLMRYDAAGIEASELFYGVAGTRTLAGAASFPIVSASVDSAGKPAFDLFVRRTIGTAEVAVVSITDSTGIARIRETRVRDFALVTPEQAIARAIAAIGPDPEFLVVLSSIPPEENEALLARFPRIDLIIEAYGNETDDTPRISPGGVRVSTGAAGQFAGTITLVKSPAGTLAVERYALIPVLDIPADPAALSLIRKSQTR